MNKVYFLLFFEQKIVAKAQNDWSVCSMGTALGTIIICNLTSAAHATMLTDFVIIVNIPYYTIPYLLIPYHTIQYHTISSSTTYLIIIIIIKS